MEDFPVALVLLIIGALVSAFGKGRKDGEKERAAKQAVKRVDPNPWDLMQQSRPAPAQPQQAPLSPEKPLPPLESQVHVHLAPDCAVHDAPTGSLRFASTEGKDPCHEDQLRHPRTQQNAAEEAPGFSLDFSPNALVQAFVMQEVLTRPCQKRR